MPRFVIDGIVLKTLFTAADVMISPKCDHMPQNMKKGHVLSSFFASCIIACTLKRQIHKPSKRPPTLLTRLCYPISNHIIWQIPS